MAPPSALFLDVGGVFHLPDEEMVQGALEAAGVEPDRSRLERAHYLGIAAVDELEGDAPDEEVWGAFCRGFADGAGAPADLLASAERRLRDAFRRPGMWSQARLDSVEALPLLAGADLRLGIVSNSDGTLEERLRDEGICQVGEGPGTPVTAIVDSGAVGVQKPDPEIFRIALDRVGVEPADAVHVGDSVRADVLGAEQAGVGALHFDPLGICGDEGHGHVRRLGELVEVLEA